MTQIQYNSIDLNETLLIAVRQMYDQYPEEEKNDSFDQALNYISSIVLTGGSTWTKFNAFISFRKEKVALDNLLSIINKGDGKQRFYDAFQCQQKNSTVIDYEKHFSCSAQQIHEKIKRCRDILSLEKHFKDAIRDSQQKLADKVSRNSSMTSSVIIVVQIIKLYFVWKEINVAKNLHNDSKKFQQIETNINMLKTIVEQLTEAMQRENMTQISRISTRAHTKYNQTKTLINDLQVKINGSLQRLDISADGQVLDGISNFSSGVGSAVQLHHLFHHASTWNTIFAFGIIAAFTLLTVANVTTYFISKSRLDELRQNMNYLDSLNQQLDQLYQIIEEAENSI
jgi:hypothetical protein